MDPKENNSTVNAYFERYQLFHNVEAMEAPMSKEELAEVTVCMRGEDRFVDNGHNILETIVKPYNAGVFSVVCGKEIWLRWRYIEPIYLGQTKVVVLDSGFSLSSKFLSTLQNGMFSLPPLQEVKVLVALHLWQ
mmetsp:Transcript_20085/g.30546  ORF Transcript_20085/g.30546 Transcript_20085/m.30546 type:complete len:134 (-) Transcript_20085:719-1120(-)